MRGEALSKAVWIGKRIKEPGLCKMCPKALHSLGSSLGKLRCNINLKQYLCPLTCFGSKQIINGFQVTVWSPPASPSGGFAGQIYCGNPW